MDILTKYRIPLFEAPEVTGGGAPLAPPAPVVAADPPAVDPARADPPAPDAPPASKGLPSSVINELTRLRATNREKDEALAQARREAAEAKALLERNAGTKPGDPPPVIPRVDPAPTQEAEIDRRAEYKLFLRDVEGVRERGNRQFGATFNETVRALAAVGADNDQFVSQVIAADRDNAHVLLNALAQDLEGTVALVNMDPNRRMAELTRRAMAATAVATTDPTKTAAPPAPPVTPKTVSKAPPPPPPVLASTTKTVDWRSDDASDAEFDRGFNEEFMRRRAARR